MSSENSQTPQEFQKLHELKKLLGEVSDELLHKIDHISQILCRLESIDSVVQHEDMAKSIIECKSVLERFPVGDSPYEPAAEPGIPNPNNQAHIRLVSFRKAMRYSVWEITSKVSVLRDFISETQSLRKALTVAMTIRKLMKLLESVEELNENTPTSTASLFTSGSGSLNLNQSPVAAFKRTPLKKVPSNSSNQIKPTTTIIPGPHLLKKKTSYGNSTGQISASAHPPLKKKISFGNSSSQIQSPSLLKPSQLKSTQTPFSSTLNPSSNLKSGTPNTNNNLTKNFKENPTSPTTRKLMIGDKTPPAVPKKPQALKTNSVLFHSGDLPLGVFEKTLQASDKPSITDSVENQKLQETERLIKQHETQVFELQKKANLTNSQTSISPKISTPINQEAFQNNDDDDLSRLSLPTSPPPPKNKEEEKINLEDYQELKDRLAEKTTLLQRKEREVEWLKRQVESLQNIEANNSNSNEQLNDILENRKIHELNNQENKQQSQNNEESKISKQKIGVDQGTQTKASPISLEEIEKSQQLLRAIDICTKELNNRLNEINEDLIFDTSKIGKYDLKEMLLLVSLLKDIRQILINYEDASYQYPSAQELKRTTQKINYLHQLGQGKMVTLYELAKNTLSEIQFNLNNFRDVLGIEDGYNTLARFSALLWHTKLVLDKTSSNNVKEDISLKDKLNRLKITFAEDRKTDNNTENEKAQMNEMQKKISYLMIKTFLWKQTLENYRKRTGTVSTSRPVKYEKQDDLTTFIGQYNNNTQKNTLANGQELCEKILTVLRNEPRYLVELIKHQNFSSLDIWVEMITTGLFADMFLVEEEYLLLKFIEVVIQHQLSATTYPSEIVRENNFLTKLLSAYTKRQSGRTHLIACLKEPLHHVISNNESCELDPVRLYITFYKVDTVEKSIAENDLQVKRLIGENTNRLTKFCHHFLDSILAALPTVPYGIRWIIRQLLVKVDNQFPNAKERDKSILVGGFMFLRYFSPAILSPETNGIIDSNITDIQRRNLTLITKVLQNLANDLFFQGKEAYMVPMTSFLKITKPALDAYFLSLGNVPPPQKQLGISSLFFTNGREILLSESDLYFLFNALKVCKDKLIKDNEDPLKPLLIELSITPAPNNTNKAPIILYVDQNLNEDEKKERELIVLFYEFLSQTLVKIPESNSLKDILEKMLEQSKDLDSNKVYKIGTQVYDLFNQGKEDFNQILNSLFNYCISKKEKTEGLLMDKIQILQALEQHRKVVNSLVDSKANYDQFLTSSSGKNITYFQWRGLRN